MSVRTHARLAPHMSDWLCVHAWGGVARYIHTRTKLELLNPTWRVAPRRHPRAAALRRRWRHMRRRADAARLHALEPRFIPCILQIVAEYVGGWARMGINVTRLN